MSTVVFFHAHPDDEATSTGGTMAKLAAEGHRVVLVTATGGELGGFPPGLLAPGETLAERRRQELAASCAALGVARQVPLGFRDSGMAGDPSTSHPGAFCQADVDGAAEIVAALLVEEEAAALVVYDEHGGYGHPDHVQVHRVGLRAAERAGTARVFMATLDRDWIRTLTALGGLGAEAAELPVDLETFGVEGERITNEIDVRRFLVAKRRALEAHASQIGDTGFFLSLDPETFALAMGTEWFVRVGVRPGPGRRHDLLA